MRYSDAARRFIKTVPVDGHLSAMVDSLSSHIKGVDHLIDLEHDASTGSDILKLVVFLPTGQDMDQVYNLCRESDRKLAHAGVNFYIAEG